jgi:hypothetical protein
MKVIISWKMRWAGHVASMGEKSVQSVDIKESEGRRPLARPKKRWQIILI